MKLPAIQFYPADWRKDPGVQSLTFHQRGVWFEIICLMHESPMRGYLLMPTGKAMTDDQLGRLIGLDRENLSTTLTELEEAGVTSRDPETGALMNRRMIRDEAFRKTRSECGKKGGNPELLGKDKVEDKLEVKLPTKLQPTPSSSTSASAYIESIGAGKSFPSIEEGEAYCKGSGMPSTHVAEWHSNRASQGWVKGNGIPISNWQADLKSWIYRQAREDIANGRGATKAAGQSKYADAF